MRPSLLMYATWAKNTIFPSWFQSNPQSKSNAAPTEWVMACWFLNSQWYQMISDKLGFEMYSKICSTGGGYLIFTLYSAASVSYLAFSISDSFSNAVFLISCASFKFPSMGVRPCSASSNFKVFESSFWFACAKSFWVLVAQRALPGLVCGSTAFCGFALKK